MVHLLQLYLIKMAIFSSFADDEDRGRKSGSSHCFHGFSPSVAHLIFLFSCRTRMLRDPATLSTLLRCPSQAG